MEAIFSTIHALHHSDSAAQTTAALAALAAQKLHMPQTQQQWSVWGTSVFSLFHYAALSVLLLVAFFFNRSWPCLKRFSQDNKRPNPRSDTPLSKTQRHFPLPATTSPKPDPTSKRPSHADLAASAPTSPSSPPLDSQTDAADDLANPPPLFPTTSTYADITPDSSTLCACATDDSFSVYAMRNMDLWDADFSNPFVAEALAQEGSGLVPESVNLNAKNNLSAQNFNPLPTATLSFDVDDVLPLWNDSTAPPAPSAAPLISLPLDTNENPPLAPPMQVNPNLNYVTSLETPTHNPRPMALSQGTHPKASSAALPAHLRKQLFLQQKAVPQACPQPQQQLPDIANVQLSNSHFITPSPESTPQAASVITQRTPLPTSTTTLPLPTFTPLPNALAQSHDLLSPPYSQHNAQTCESNSSTCSHDFAHSSPPDLEPSPPSQIAQTSSPADDIQALGTGSTFNLDDLKLLNSMTETQSLDFNFELEDTLAKMMPSMIEEQQLNQFMMDSQAALLQQPQQYVPHPMFPQSQSAQVTKQQQPIHVLSHNLMPPVFVELSSPEHHSSPGDGSLSSVSPPVDHLSNPSRSNSSSSVSSDHSNFGHGTNVLQQTPQQQPPFSDQEALRFMQYHMLPPTVPYLDEKNDGNVVFSVSSSYAMPQSAVTSERTDSFGAGASLEMGSFQQQQPPSSLPAPKPVHVPSSHRGRTAEGHGESKEYPYVCPHCQAAFRIRGYLTRHMKKHAVQKAYRCPFYNCEEKSPCHPTGGFSRRDTYKTHLKARHFSYPQGTRSEHRSKVGGMCRGCGSKFESNERWVEEHIHSRECPALANRANAIFLKNNCM